MSERISPFVYNENYEYLKGISDKAPRFPYNLRYFVKAYQEIFFPLGIKPGQALLDVGCCLGNLGHYFQKAGVETTGIDLNLAALIQGRIIYPRNSKNPLLQADATALPFQNRSFDYVVSQDVLEHMPDEEALTQTFNEMTRVLRGNRMYHKITVSEDTFCIDADSSHFLKWPAQKWQEWFRERGWNVTAPTSCTVFSWTKRSFVSVNGYFLIENRQPGIVL